MTKRMLSGWMRRARVVVVMAAATLAACVAVKPPDIFPEPAMYADVTQPGTAFHPEEFLRLINNYRQQNGAGPLTLDPALTSVAQSYASALARAGVMTHDLQPYGRLDQRLNAAGYPWEAAEENLGEGQKSIAEIFAGWRASPEHDKAMRNGEMTRMGIAFAINRQTRYQIYWALILANPRSRPAYYLGGMPVLPLPVTVRIGG